MIFDCNLLFFTQIFIDLAIVAVTGVGSSMIKNAAALEKVPLSTLLGKNTSRVVVSLINSLLIFNPTKRLTAEEALEHEYISVFHDPEQEIVLSRDIVMPFSDDVRLSVEDYRNKLYEIMSTHHNRNSRPQIYKTKIIESDHVPRVYRNIVKTVSNKDKSCVTHSEPKINLNSRSTNHCVSSIRSDSRVAKQNIQFPNHLSYDKAHINARLNNITKEDDHQLKKRFPNRKTGFSCNSYHQTHGIISKSTLMGLKTAGLR